MRIEPITDHRRLRAESASADFHALRRGIDPPADHHGYLRAEIHPPTRHRRLPAESGFAKHPLGSADFHALRRGIDPPAGHRRRRLYTADKWRNTPWHTS